MLKYLAIAIFKVSGWKPVGDVPREGILVGAPHTSYWDFVFTLLILWRGEVPPRVLMKKELFKGPAGPFLRALGGIPVDRTNSTGLVQKLVDEARASDKPFVLVLAAEGTREKKKYWKSGFYRLAEGTGLPIALAFLDGPTKTVGFGPSLVPTGDIKADMDVLRAFYADKRGVHPDRVTPPRLREEDEQPSS